MISGGGATCANAGPRVNRFCGGIFSNVNAGTINIPICGNYFSASFDTKAHKKFPPQFAYISDCTSPFKVDIITNAVSDIGTGTVAGPNTIQSRGRNIY